MKKETEKRTLEREASFWHGIKKALIKDTTKRCHK
ncbi:MAG: hypothetical protein A4E61_00498 [Syntrophorhabdus sp. PtaB.Bin184]|jgi:hypothetical protein|nr:MAG: hypothetical protein A4E61_00498 [Syntrophorhabdus sp. PtaB.Bin184]